MILREMEPYECLKCGKWHRRPAGEADPIPQDVLCLHCTGQSGMPKQSYATLDDATRAARDARPGLELGVYACPHGRGYHLTST